MSPGHVLKFVVADRARSLVLSGTIDSYLVNFHNSTNKTSLTVKSVSTSITFMNLRPYTNYNVTVRAYANATTKSRRDTLVHYFFKGQRSDAVRFTTHPARKLCHGDELTGNSSYNVC